MAKFLVLSSLKEYRTIDTNVVPFGLTNEKYELKRRFDAIIMLTLYLLKETSL